MKSLIAYAVLRPVAITVIYLALTLFGFVSLRALAVDLFPEMDVPQITVTTAYEGVAPEEMETLVTRPVEQATAAVEGVQRMEAVSSEGLSRVQLQFAWGTSLEVALDEVRVAIDRVKPQLPEDAETPLVHKLDLASAPIAMLGLTGNDDTRRLKHLAEEDLSRALERVPGVASVEVNGGRDREIRVALSSARLEALGVTSEQVAAALRKENRTVSAGDMRDAGRSVVIRTAGEFASVEDVGAVVVATREGNPIRVQDIGTVSDTIRKVRSELWIDGEPGITLQVFKQSGANTVTVGEALAAEVEKINKTYQGRARLDMLWEGATFIRASVNNVQWNAVLGGLLGALVLLVFLRSLRATVVVSTAIPISVIATFAVMYYRGMTLNIVSFGGLALGTGTLVDCAIVILENIYRKRAEGLSPIDAAITGAHEVAGAVTSGTFTCVVVFAPIVFLGGLAGVLFSEMALVVTFSQFISLGVALTLVPMLAARMLKRGEPPQTKLFAWLSQRIEAAWLRLENGYGRVLEWAFAAPWAIVVGAMALLVSSAVFATRIDTELMPEADEGMLEIDMELAPGTPLESTTAVTRELEKKTLATLKSGELRHVVTSAGPEAWWRPGGSHESEVELTLVPVGERDRSVGEVQRAVAKALSDTPGAKLRLRSRSSNQLTRIVRRGEDRLSIEVRGHDLTTVDQLAEQVIAAVEQTPGISYARADRESGHLERVLRVDRERAAELGIGSAEIAEAVEHYILGRVATRLRERGDEFDVRVQLAEADRDQLALLSNLPIVTPSGKRVPLGSLVTVEQSNSPSSIRRIDQERVLRIDVGRGQRQLAALAADLNDRISAVPVPDGYSIGLGGELAQQRETFHELLLGILLACCLVYAVMAVQFESIRQPLVVMGSVPFALIGIVATLLLTGTTFSMNAFLGAIVLVGIVVNNAIVLVDCANQLRRDHGMELQSALIAAGTRRLRPILMTTVATVLGLIPLAVASAEGGEVQSPLARVIVGGLTTSTLVTLVLIPCLYLLAEKRARVPEALASEVGAEVGAE